MVTFLYVCDTLSLGAYAEFNNGIFEYDIKERMRYKGIAKLYTNFNMAISQIMIGSKCSEKIKRELMCYCETNKIKIEYVQINY